MAGLNFDANTVEPQAALEVIPPGWYNASIVESEMKPTSAGDGAYLKLAFQILDGQYKGRKVFTNLNLQNPNQVAVEIAYKQLSAICHATGVIQVQDSQQLHGIPLQVQVKVRPASGQYDAQNEVKGFKKIEMAGAPAGGPPPGFAAAPPPAQPWTPPAPIQAPPPVQAPPPTPPPAVAAPAPMPAPQATWTPPPAGAVASPTGPVGGPPAPADGVPPWMRPAGT